MPGNSEIASAISDAIDPSSYLISKSQARSTAAAISKLPSNDRIQSSAKINWSKIVVLNKYIDHQFYMEIRRKIWDKKNQTLNKQIDVDLTIDWKLLWKFDIDNHSLIWLLLTRH